MKLSPRNLRVQWDLHGALGVVMALPLFVVFFCGSIGAFASDIVVWQEPHLATGGQLAPDPSVYDHILGALEADGRLGPDDAVSISVAPEARALRVVVNGDERRSMWVDGTTLRRSPVRSRAAQMMVGLHYLEPVPGGLYLAGLLAVGLLILLVSGVLMQLRGMMRSLWRFRPQLQRRHWGADIHRALGLLSTPFVLVMASSGALLGVGGPLGAGLVALHHNGEVEQLQTLRGYGPPPRPRSGRAVQTLRAEALVRAAQRSVGEDSLPEYLGLKSRGDAAALATMFWPSRLGAPWRYVFVDGATGGVTFDTSHASSLSRQIEEPIFAVHFGWFGGRLAKATLSVLGFSGCILILAGLVVWLDRRAQRRPPGHRLLSRAAIAVCVGLVAATSLMFALTRVPPAEWNNPIDREVAAFWFTWGGVAGSMLLCRWPLAPVGSVVLLAASLGFVGPVVSDLVSLPHAFATLVGSAAYRSATGVMLVLAALCVGAAAAMCSRRWAPATIRQR